ncbi:MAG TPA: hypothetical protein VH855_26135 [Acetobacteraceae bacterium]|jgi:hypothetical protein
MRGWTSRRQRAIYPPFIVQMQLATVALIESQRSPALAGMAADLNLLLFIPPVLFGTGFGLSIFGRLSERGFGVALNLALLASGIGLVV